MDSLDLGLEKFKHSLLAGLFVRREFYMCLDFLRITEWNTFVEQLREKMITFEIPSKSLGLENFDCSLLKIS